MISFLEAYSFFFFQAEDGIRYLIVTGVQTCALPISAQVGTNVVQGGSAAQVLSSTDAGDLLRKSESAVGVETQRRSPIANESRIRGYHLGELDTVADGAVWFPARLDLDTFLSKIDSGDISNIIVLKGP